MRTLKIFYLLAFCFWVTKAQQPADTVAATRSFPPTMFWKHSTILSMNMTQTSYSDWAQGGANSLAYAFFLEGKSTYATSSLEWGNSYKFAYGQAKIGSQGTRKTDDKIDFESVFVYKLGVYVNPFVSVSLKTQFVEGRKYNASGVGTPVSNFFDPAYLTQAAGVGYQPLPEVRTRLGVAIREIITKNYSALYTDDPTTTKVEKIKIDGGLESVGELGYNIMENVALTSTLNIFWPIKNIKMTVLRSDNTISAKVNKLLSVNFNVLLLNDPQIQKRTQVKQTLAVGFSYQLL